MYYNSVIIHQGINYYTYELATDLKLENPNEWLELIQISKKQ